MRSLQPLLASLSARLRRRASRQLMGRAGGACLLGLALCASPIARADTVAEYRLKAAFLFNFASFTEWPDSLGDTLTVCVHGEDPFGASLDGIAGKPIGKRTTAVRRTLSADGLNGCDVVFVTQPVISNLPRIFDQLAQRPVLVVADSPGATQRGVMLNMETSGGKVSFAANLSAARRHGLNLSARLLSLATEVIQ